MKQLNNYIIEKLKVNKDSQVDEVESIVDELDAAWEKAGFDLSGKGDDEWLEKSKIFNDKNTNYSHLEYALFFKADKDSKPTLRLDIFIVKRDKHLPVEVCLRFRYNNGKYGSSISSNVNRILKKEFALSKDPITYNNMMGKKVTHYECTDEVLKKLVNGIDNLKNKKDIFKSAISKIRFTQQQWDKLIEELNDIFDIKY